MVLACTSACGFSGASSPSHTPDASGSNSPDASTAGGGDSGPCKDDDGDTICNEVDQCPGQDDRIDVDGDQIPDCKDDWLCGATKPNGPSQPLIVFETAGQWDADHDHIAGGGNVVNVKAGMPIAIAFDWNIRVNCPGFAQPTQCPAQLELGFAGVGRDRCIFDGQVTDGAIRGGTLNDMVTVAPTPSGAYQEYDLRLNIGLRSSCGTSGWDGGEPGSSATFAKLCVVK